MGLTFRLVVLVIVNCYFHHKSTAQPLVQEIVENSKCPNFKITVEGLKTDMTGISKKLTELKRIISSLNKRLEDTKSPKIDDAKFTVAFPYISTDTIRMQMSPKSTYYITTFDVSYTKGDGATVHRKKVAAESLTKVALSSLESGTEYLISIQAYQRNTGRVLGGPVRIRVSTDVEEQTVFTVKMKNVSCCSILLGLESTSTSPATHFDITYSSWGQKMVFAGTIPAGPQAEFEIKSLKAETSYNIDVTAFNKGSLGFIGNAVALRIKTIPIVPEVTLLSYTCCSVHLGFEMIQPVNVTKYSVILTDIQKSHRRQLDVEAAHGISQALFSNLRENAEHKVEVVSHVDKPSNRIKVLTFTTKPMVSDVAIRSIVIQSSSIILEIHFAPVLKADGYTVRFSRTGSPELESKSESISSASTRAEFRLTDLQPRTRYLISVDATADDETVASSNATVMTLPQFPADVPVVSIGEITNYTIWLIVTPQPRLNVTTFRFIPRVSAESIRFWYDRKSDGSWKLKLYNHIRNTSFCTCLGIQSLQGDYRPTAAGSPYPFCGCTKNVTDFFS